MLKTTGMFFETGASNVADRGRKCYRPDAWRPCRGGYFNQALCIGNMEITEREAEFEIAKVKKGLSGLITKSPRDTCLFLFYKAYHFVAGMNIILPCGKPPDIYCC
jgi:hypothetical protein